MTDTSATVARITAFLDGSEHRADRAPVRLWDGIHEIPLSDLRAIRPLLIEGLTVVTAAREFRDQTSIDGAGERWAALCAALDAFDGAERKVAAGP
jgi:hypothetical protein